MVRLEVLPQIRFAVRESAGVPMGTQFLLAPILAQGSLVELVGGT